MTSVKLSTWYSTNVFFSNFYLLGYRIEYFTGKLTYTGVLHSNEIYHINIKHDKHEKTNNISTTLILTPHE